MKSGNRHAVRKLDPDDVRAIRQIHREKQAEVARLHATCGIKALAEKWEVHPRTIENVVGFISYRWVK